MSSAYKYTAYIGLGSNLQDPVRQVSNAFSHLGQLPKTTVVKISSLYVTQPMGYDVQQQKTMPDFINAVVEVSTDLSPLELLEAILGIENAAGRERPFANAPRVLDCDLLLYDDFVMQSEQLTLPHPRMHLRNFVLLPLAEIAPQFNLPRLTDSDGGMVTKFQPSYLNQSTQK